MDKAPTGGTLNFYYGMGISWSYIIMISFQYFYTIWSELLVSTLLKGLFGKPFIIPFSLHENACFMVFLIVGGEVVRVI